MINYIVKRVFLAIITIWAVATITFFMMNLVPGGPFMGEKALEEKYGLDKPLIQQYTTYMKGILHGDFSESLKQRGRSVSSIIITKFPVSAKIGGIVVLVVSQCLVSLSVPF